MRYLLIVFVLAPLVLSSQKPSKQKLDKTASQLKRLDSAIVSRDSILKRLQNEVTVLQNEVQKTKNDVEHHRQKADSTNAELKLLKKEVDNTSWLEKIELFLAFISGFLLSLVSLIISNNNSIRNVFFKEFRVEIFQDRINTNGDRITLIDFYLEMNYKNSEDIVANYAYFKISKNESINSREHATLADQIFGEPGRFYFGFSSMTFKAHRRIMYTVTDEKFLKLFDGKRRKKFQVVVNTSKYGNVESKVLLFTQGRNSFRHIIIDSIVDLGHDLKKFLRKS